VFVRYHEGEKRRESKYQPLTYIPFISCRLTSIVSPRPTRITARLTTGYPSFDSDSISDFEMRYSLTYFDDLSSGFMACSSVVADDHGWTYAAVFPEVDVGSGDRRDQAGSGRGAQSRIEVVIGQGGGCSSASSGCGVLTPSSTFTS
jgi:hypothetical protein